MSSIERAAVRIDGIEVRFVGITDRVFPEILRMRYELIDQQYGVPKQTEANERDRQPGSHHLVAYTGGVIAAGLRIRYLQGPWEVGRAVTLPEWQRRGIGTILLRAAEAEILARDGEGALIKGFADPDGTSIEWFIREGYALNGEVYAWYDGRFFGFEKRVCATVPTS